MGLYAVLGIVVAICGLGLWLSRGAAAKARAKQAEARLEARDIADQVDNDVGALPKGAAREELRKWGR